MPRSPFSLPIRAMSSAKDTIAAPGPPSWPAREESPAETAIPIATAGTAAATASSSACALLQRARDRPCSRASAITFLRQLRHHRPRSREPSASAPVATTPSTASDRTWS